MQLFKFIMTQEEKAKRYDEAIERARAFNSGEDCNIEAGTTLCEYIFPELKEREDERIRKELTKFLKKASGGLLDTTIQCKTFGKWHTWLEKQGEKPQGKSALEAINEEKVDNQNCVKPTDKVKSRFKVGDWIVCEELNTAKISSINIDRYEVEFINGSKGFPHIDYIDRNFRLWTIQDAKDGDVLAINWHEGGDSWEKIIIFKKYHNNGVEGLISSPCVEGYGNTFKSGKLVFHEEVPYFSKTWLACLHPATKE